MARTMDRVEKLALIERSLGLRHKLKVLESMKAPETHEDLAVALIAKWELEDELRAIEEILASARQNNVAAKRAEIEKEGGIAVKPKSAKKSAKK